MERRHGWRPDTEWIRHTPGVVPALAVSMLAFTQPGDGILVQPPVYYPFFAAITGRGRRVVENPLAFDGERFWMDFEDLERKLDDSSVKMAFLCSPHNPGGRVWTREELEKFASLCAARGIIVISDEIHQDFVYGEHEHVPTATLGDYDEFLLTMTAPSKTFNLAGLQNSIIIIPDPKLRARWDSFQHRLHMKGGNSIGFVAAEAAYKGGREWLDEVKEQIYSNFVYARDFLAKELPDVGVADLQGTYLMWMDFGKWFKTQEEVKVFFQDKCGIALDYGEWFGGEDYVPFVRMNLATSHEIVDKAVQIIIREIKKL